MTNFILNIFKRFEEKPLDAKKASIMSRYGTDEPFDKIVKARIKKIEDQICDKIRISGREKIITFLVPEDQKDLFEEVKKHFSKMGFKTFYAGKENIAELGDNIYLFISWDV